MGAMQFRLSTIDPFGTIKADKGFGLKCALIVFE